jgi:hypothetical protein
MNPKYSKSDNRKSKAIRTPKSQGGNHSGFLRLGHLECEFGMGIENKDGDLDFFTS